MKNTGEAERPRHQAKPGESGRSSEITCSSVMGEERRVKCGLDVEMHLKEGMTQRRKVDNRTNKVFIQQIELCVLLKLFGFKIPLQS